MRSVTTANVCKSQNPRQDRNAKRLRSHQFSANSFPSLFPFPLRPSCYIFSPRVVLKLQNLGLGSDKPHTLNPKFSYLNPKIGVEHGNEVSKPCSYVFTFGSG